MTAPPSILIVDDSPTNLQIVGRMLNQQLECELSFATSGPMALESIAEARPDLILLDVMMPGMNGFEVCRNLKTDPVTANIPVIFLTARSKTEDVVEGFEVGGVDYVTKPFSQAELLARVQTHIQLRRSADTIAGKNDDLWHLLHILCHDLANPIGSLEGLLQMCRHDPGALEEHLPDMAEITRQALDQIKLVSEMHRVEEGRYSLEVTAFPLREALLAAERSLALKYRAKNLRLTHAISPDLEVVVEPISFINSVLGNLLSNAVKFSFRGTEVVVEAVPEENGFVALHIRDSGIGIPPARLANLFVPSSKPSTPGTEGETGTGFGMPLVKSFTEAYGGTISVVSRDDKNYPRDHGTTVSLLLRCF